jgi:hypothetical protein
MLLVLHKNYNKYHAKQPCLAKNQKTLIIGMSLLYTDCLLFDFALFTWRYLNGRKKFTNSNRRASNP